MEMVSPTPQMIDPRFLPALPLDERASLPGCAAIYFALAADGEVLYVGRTVALAQRWWRGHHHLLDALVSIGNVRIAWLEVSEPSMLPGIEQALIDYHKPRLNRTPGRKRATAHMGALTPMTILLPDGVLRRVKALAEQTQTPVSILLRQWIIERILEEG